MYVIIVVTLAVIVIVWLLEYRKWRRNLPPGPPCIPVIGNWGQIDTTDTLAEYRRLRSLYGDVFCFLIGSQPTVVINGMNAIKDLLVTRGHALLDRPEIFIMRKLNKGLGILASNGNLWKEHRTFAMHTIRNLSNGEPSIESVIKQEVNHFMESIKQFRESPFDPTKSLNIGMVNIISWFMFGKRFRDDDKKFNRFLHLMDAMVNDPSLRIIAGYYLYAEHLPGDPFKVRRRKEINDEIVGILQEEITLHRLSLEKDTVRDYIDSFIRIQKQQSWNPEMTFTDPQLVQTIRDFMVAGSDTSATAIRWALIHLIRYPDVQSKMREEIHHVLGKSEVPSMADKSRLPYCEATIMESQRLNHSIPIPIPRGVDADVKWNNYTIPRGAMIMINLDSVAKDPDIFPNPEIFDPCRFLNSDGTFNNKKLIFPFSTGKRSCPGADIARMEMFLFLTTLVQKFDILPVDDLSTHVEATLVATSSPKPFKLRFIEI